MPGYSTPVSSGLSGTTVLTDNTDPASLIEIALPDGKDLLEFDTSDNAVKLTMHGGFTHSTNESSGLVGIREAAPKAPLHIVGTGGSTGMSVDVTQNYNPTVFIENGSNNTKDRCLMILNGDGGSGASIDLHHTDSRRLGLAGFGSAATIFSDNGVPLQLSSASGSGLYISLTTGGAERLKIDNDGRITSNAEASPLCDVGGVHLLGSAATSNSGVNSGARLLVLEDDHTDGSGMTIISGTTKKGAINFTDTHTQGWIHYYHNLDCFRIGAGGSEQLRIYSSGVIVNGGITPTHEIHLQDGDLGIVTNSADANAQSLVFTKSRKADDGGHTIVDDNDVLGEIEFKGSDGNSFELGAKIFARVDGTPSEGSDMPSELVFATSADGSATPSERLNISSAGVAKFAGNVEVEKDSPVLILDNSTAEDSSGGRESTIQFEGVATRGSGTATTLGSMRYQHLGTGTGNRSEFVIAINNSNDSGTTDTLTDRLRILGDSGTMRLGGVFQTGDGNAGSPSHGFTDSSNTGMFHDGSNGLAYSANGGEKMRITSTGKVGIGETAPLCADLGLHIRTDDSGGTVESGADDLVVERADGPGMTFLMDTGTNQSTFVSHRRGTSNMFLQQVLYTSATDVSYKIREMQQVAGATIEFVPIGASVGAGADQPALTLGGGTNPIAKVDSNGTRQLTNTGSSNNHGSSPRVIDCTAHGLIVGEAVVLLSGNSGNTNKETFTNTAKSTDQFTVDSDPSHATSSKIVKADPEKLLQVNNVDGKELFCVGRSTNLIWHDGQVSSIGGTQTTALVTEYYGNDIPGSQNVLIGPRAGKASSGSQMVIIGSEAGEGGAGTGSTVVGWYAGNAGTGAQSTLIGAKAGQLLQSGAHYNVCLGHQAGNAITTGDDNTMLGENCDGAAAASNQIAIGHDAISTIANECVIGDTLVAALRPMTAGQFLIGRAGFEVAGMVGYGGGVLMGRAAAVSSINADAKILAQVFASSASPLTIPANSYVIRMGITSTSNADSNAYSVTLNTGTATGESALGALTGSVERIGAGESDSRTSASTGSAADLAVAATSSHAKVTGITTEGFWTGASDLYVYVMTAGTGNANTGSGLNFKFGVYVEYIGMD